MIAVTGMGGLGKTSLVGHWLKRAGGATRRRVAGLFFWSFYAERDVAAFARAFIDFAVNEARAPPPPNDAQPAEAALAVLRAVPLLLVLDGLEVLQDIPDATTYGTLVQDDLRALLDGACRLKHAGLVVLTSRFPFVDLTPYLGRGFGVLDLDHLSPAEGAALLHACGVDGTPAEREAVTRSLDGHPLGLRIFALTLAQQADGDPSRPITQAFDAVFLSETDSLERKLKHLLAFYEKRLPRERVALLGLVSFFRAPAPQATIITLAKGLPAVAGALAGLGKTGIERALQAMGREHLLIRDIDESGAQTWSCHPILRDHFRQALLGWAPEIGKDAAGMLAGRPSRGRPADVRAIQPVLDAIALLLDAGDFKGANSLYRERLANGLWFRWLPAPGEGLICALGFIGDTNRRSACKRALSRQREAFYLSWAGLCAKNAGEFESAMSFLVESAKIDRDAGDSLNLCIALQNQSETHVIMGDLRHAQFCAREALRLAGTIEVIPAEQTRNALSYMAEALANEGRVGEALAAFEAANALEQALTSGRNVLRGRRGTRWTNLLVRLGHTDRARTLTDANLAICLPNRWAHSIARCHRVLADEALLGGRVPDAEQDLIRAETVVRRARLYSELPRTLLVRAALERQRGRHDAAEAAIDEALRIAAPRGMRLDHADALVLRGRLRLDRNDPDRAGDDAEAALRIAQDCGYAWAERDALTLLADVAAAQGNAAIAATHRRDAETLSRRLGDTTPPADPSFGLRLPGLPGTPGPGNV